MSSAYCTRCRQIHPAVRGGFDCDQPAPTEAPIEDGRTQCATRPNPFWPMLKAVRDLER